MHRPQKENGAICWPTRVCDFAKLERKLVRHDFRRRNWTRFADLFLENLQDQELRGVEMRAIVLNGFGGVESLVIKELPDPEPKALHVLIAVKAFGLNHAETHMRRGEWAEATEVSRIEYMGEVIAAPTGEFQRDDKITAFINGMSRTINGSYAELTLVPATNVVKIRTNLP